MTDELDALLPPDPKPSEIFQMPEGQVGGASNMNFVYAGGVCIGHTSQFARVANVSSRSFLGRTVTSAPLTEGVIIRVLGEQFTFKTLIFVEFFGWVVYEYNPKPKVLLDAKFTVVHAIPMVKQNSALYTYDRVCLENHKEETDARTANDATRGDATRGDATRGDAAGDGPSDAATTESSRAATATTVGGTASGDPSAGPGTS
jgi:hypothetical protein